MNWIREIESINKSNVNAALCIVVGTKGSTPRCMGAKMIVFENGDIKGTIGGGDLEKKVITNAIAQIKSGSPQLFRHDLLHQHSMCCGGTVEIFIEPLQKEKRLYIFGAGHTGKALSKLAVDLDFETFVIDDRDEYISNFNIAGVNKMNTHHSQILPLLPFNEHTYIVIMTYNHSYDRDILAHCIQQPHAYLGMIGSKRKVELTKKMFAAAKIAASDELAKVDMPMGLPVHAETPEEIAISIMAKLIQVRNQPKIEMKLNPILKEQVSH